MERETGMADVMEVAAIRLDDAPDVAQLFGSNDGNLKTLEERLSVEAVLRQDELIIRGRRAAEAKEIIGDLLFIIEKGETLDEQKLEYVISLRAEGASYRDSEISKDILAFTQRGKPIRPKTLGQKEYAAAIRGHEIVFGVGPAGTGKTYLAVAMAVSSFKNRDVEKIILARPAVEAGERLGFLPGDLQEKVDPYLRPLYDALYEIMGR